MPRINLTVQPELYEFIVENKPRSLSLPAFCALLIEKGLDTSCTLGGPSAAGTPSTSYSSSTSYLNTTSLKKNIKQLTSQNAPINADDCEVEPVAVAVPAARSVKARKPKAEGTPEFEAFWRQYQAIKRRASNQSKPRALEAWAEVTASVTPVALQSALTTAVNDQARREAEGGFASPFPDCFRWLRDGYYEAFLDASSPTPLIQKPNLTPPPEFADCPF